MQKYIFNRKYIKSQLNHYKKDDIENYSAKQQIIKNWNYSIKESDIEKTKEVSLQGDFLHQIFTLILGYKGRIGKSLWNLMVEKKTIIDSTVADGALGFFSDTISDTRVVIELKDAKTDLDRKQNRKNNQSPVEQAFSYQYKHKNCEWVIVSNFKEIRLYNSSTMTEYEQFYMEELASDEDEFKKFYYFLNSQNLLQKTESSFIDKLYIQNEKEQEKISENFYKDYKAIRLELYIHLRENNSKINEIKLLEKSQKILDRFIFVCFCEDSNLLPHKVFRQVVQSARNSFDISETKVWDQLKGLFASIDKGNTTMNINKFNGGLFKEDTILDNLVIKDEIFPMFEDITDYDFNSELDVNLLGHIFEQSISDIEEFKSEIQGEEFDKTKSKQKKDGIFYTPNFVTQFIVNKTIGEWLENKEIELGVNELPKLTENDLKKIGMRNYKTQNQKIKRIEEHIEYYTKLQEVLWAIKIIDPACGSGAFLNAAFEFLYQKGIEVNQHLENLTGNISLFAHDKHILVNNLYGVDINQESVEITKLSLWLKTANKREPLTSLDKNILCGNSIVDHYEYDSNPFIWEDSFPSILKNGGFDIVIGNPPYVRQELIVPIKPYLKKNYETYHGRSDLYVFFFEKAFQILKSGGKIGYICSSKYTTTTYGLSLRSYLLKNSRIQYFIDFDDLDVFKGIVAYPSIFIADKDRNVAEQDIQYCYFEKMNGSLESYFEQNKRIYFQSKMEDNVWNFLEDNIYNLNNKLLTKYNTLEEVIGKPSAGVKTGGNLAFILTKDLAGELIQLDSNNVDIIKPYLNGKDVKPYSIISKLSIIFPYKENKNTNELELVEIKEYPIVKQHLEKHRNLLENRAIIKDGLKNGTKSWYEYQQINKSFSLDKTYIVYPDIANRSSFAITQGNVLDMTLFWLESDEPYRELAILNSSVFNFLFNLISTTAKGGYNRFKTVFMTKIPYVNVKGDDTVEKLVKESMKQSIIEEEFMKSIENYIINKYNIRDIKQIIEKWYMSSFQDILKTLKKQKAKLSQDDEYQFYEFIEKKKNELNQIKDKGAILHQGLDDKVIELYGITSEEKNIIISNL